MKETTRWGEAGRERVTLHSIRPANRSSRRQFSVRKGGGAKERGKGEARRKNKKKIATSAAPNGFLHQERQQKGIWKRG